MLERADRIVVLEEGRARDEGSHAELIARPGSYRTAWELQTEQGAPEAAEAARTSKAG